MKKIKLLKRKMNLNLKLELLDLINLAKLRYSFLSGLASLIYNQGVYWQVDLAHIFQRKKLKPRFSTKKI